MFYWCVKKCLHCKSINKYSIHIFIYTNTYTHTDNKGLALAGEKKNSRARESSQKPHLLALEWIEGAEREIEGEGEREGMGRDQFLG